MSNSITLPAFAKINWSLRVIGRRGDGYHEIDTVFQTISLCDTIRITSTEENPIVLSCDDRSLPSDERNLVWRAAAALRVRCAIQAGARIRLEKRIPVHAGLGGGSADALATLLGLAYLWNATITESELLELAAGLGADVPVFLYGGTARGTGTGTEIAPLRDAADKFLLVLKPNANISTSKAYEALNAAALTTSDAKTILSSSQRNSFPDSFSSAALLNDFAAVVLQLEPEIERARVALMKAGASAALLAGSGAAVFGVFDNKDAQERAIQNVELETGWRVFPCSTVGRNHYRSAMGAAGDILARFNKQ
ncbi:MAG TPA: 4-(cytidine 5'-diphospho)-2-C-methyl-D-erythritol kinase [Pyrinomonadaceae bacterium]|nr:4-(cytidine 5'-diphospho)-2-C-methyl-D-erythritol kinase [Pyrinomonadaceae bacterium]